MEIQVQALKTDQKCGGLTLLVESQPSQLDNCISNGNADINNRKYLHRFDSIKKIYHNKYEWQYFSMNIVIVGSVNGCN